jgi:hypothetical protein
MSTVWDVTRGAALVALALGCSGQSARHVGDGDDDETPTYSKSPIVFSTYNAHGTFFMTIERPVPKLVTPYRYADVLSLSPSRRLLFQRSDHANLYETEIAAELFELTPNGKLVTALPLPGSALGWTLDDELIYLAATTLLRIGPDGTVRSEVPFPVDRVSLYLDLSPDGSAVAFVTSTPTGADFLEVIDVRSGATLDRWELPESGQMIWSSNGAIVLAAYVSQRFYTVAPGDSGLAGPFALPFQPCLLDDWVDPHIVHMKELVGGAPYNSICTSSWLVPTDGTAAQERTEIDPIAFSPDRKKLLTGYGNLVVTDLDLGNPIQLPGEPDPALPIVW